MSRRPLLRFALLAGLLAGPCQQAAAQQPVDLVLVLAVDSSSSVNPREFDLQMRGIAEAFREPEVHAAIAAAGGRGVGLALMQWAGRERQVLALDWMLVEDAGDALELADQIDATPRLVTGGSTAIADAIAYGRRLIETAPWFGARAVIDVSGDGRSNQGMAPDRERDAAVDAGLVINGLAILNEEPNLDLYYRDSVVGGPGAFVLTATDYEDFARAIRMKLVRELSGSPLVQQVLPPPQLARRPGTEPVPTP